MAEVAAHRLLRGDEPTVGRKCLGHGAGPQVHLARIQAVVLIRPVSGPPENAERMCLVDEQEE